MGRPKATLQLGDDERLLDRIHEAIATLELPITLVGEGPLTKGGAHLERVQDASGVVGPLAGILGAMEHDPDAAWMILACDLPLIRPAAAQWLTDQREPAIAAVLPRLSEHRVEPLFAIYEPSARSLLWTIAQSGSPAPKRLAGHPLVGTPEPPPELRDCWTNVNTPDDLATLSLHPA